MNISNTGPEVRKPNLTVSKQTKKKEEIKKEKKAGRIRKERKEDRDPNIFTTFCKKITKRKRKSQNVTILQKNPRSRLEILELEMSFGSKRIEPYIPLFKK